MGRPSVSAATMVMMVRVPGAEILGAHLDLYRAIRMDGRPALAVVAPAAPGVDREAQTALDRTGARISALMPQLLPIDQLGAFLQLRR